MSVTRKVYIDIPKSVKDAANKFLEAAGIAVAGQAKELCPVDSGRLRGSITWATNKKGSQTEAPSGPEDGIKQRSVAYEVAIGSNVIYAEYMEYGTARMPTGKPYLRPALRMLKGKLKTLWSKLYREAINA